MWFQLSIVAANSVVKIETTYSYLTALIESLNLLIAEIKMTWGLFAKGSKLNVLIFILTNNLYTFSFALVASFFFSPFCFS